MFAIRRWLALLATIITSVLHFLTTAPGSIDDAFILLVYARHLVHGGALYYNQQDLPVDGFTSPLDLLIKSAVMRLSHADPISVTWWVSLILHVGVALFGFHLAEWLARRQRLESPLVIATVAGIVLGSAQALGDGSAFLLETPLWVLLGLAATSVVLFAPPVQPTAQVALGALLIAVLLARPEGLALSLMLLVLLVRERRWLIAGSIFTVGAAVYYFWHIHKFGYWAPNTYYAKTSASRWNELRDGLQYVADFAQSRGVMSLAWLVFAPLAVRGFLDSRMRQRFLLITLLSWAMLGVAIYSGGDCYSGGRFLALALALATVGLVVAVIHLDRRSARFAWAILSVQLGVQMVLLVVSVISTFALSKEPVRFPLSERAFACDRAASVAVANLLTDRPGAVVAQTDFQRMKYFVDEQYVRDLSGLNDQRIAHRRVDGPVVWGKHELIEAARMRPEVMILGHHIGANARAMGHFSLAAVFRDEALHSDFFGYGVAPPIAEALIAAYVTASVPVCGGYFNFLLRRDVASALRPLGTVVTEP